jgi:hypothetical protein
MRALLLPLLSISLLALALAACAGGTGPAVAEAKPWRPAVGVPGVECRWDEHVAPRLGPALEAACRQDPGCGCAALGHALLMESNGAVETRALEVLDGACHRGVLLSCDEAAMVEELCVRGTARPSPACEVLEVEGRLARGTGSAEMQSR